MLPTNPAPVKPSSPSLATEQAIIWAVFGGLAVLLWQSGVDTLLAKAVYHPQGNLFTYLMRQYASTPALVLGVLGLGALFWPKLWQKNPTLYLTAAVFSLSLILGSGLFNQIIMKNLADRPRPRESVLVATPAPPPADSFTGNSMPSGHAAVGFVLAAPFFPLRRRKPLLAKVFLAGGVAAGLTVGFSRMVLGAHFATDVLIAGAIALSSASLLAWLLERHGRVSPPMLAAGTVLCGLCVLLGNRFTGLELTLPLNQPFRHIELPCTVEAVNGPPVLTVTLRGYGAPLSNLALQNDGGIIRLQRSHGLYHHLACTATLGRASAE